MKRPFTAFIIPRYYRCILLFCLSFMICINAKTLKHRDIYEHDAGKVGCSCVYPAEDGCPNNSKNITTGSSFDDASNAASIRAGQESFWNCLLKRVLGINPGDRAPTCTVKGPGKPTKDKNTPDFDYSKCDRSSGYEVVRDRICQQMERKKYCGPKGYSHCKEIRIRKEVRDLNKEELADLTEAVSTLTGTKGQSGKSLYMEFVELTKKGRHLGMVNGTPAVLPWYRKCLYELENELRKIKPNVTIPYWDWSLDSQSPEKSVVFSPEFFGGSAPEGSCIYGDLVKGIDCVKRVWKNDIVPSLPSPDVLRILMGISTNFEDFSSRLEVLQGMVNVAIGGVSCIPGDSRPLGDLSGINAANDPLFWLIVAFSDKLWATAYARNQCIRIVDDVPLWHFGKNSKENESISSLCYMYLPSSIYRKTLHSMGYYKCENPCKPVTKTATKKCKPTVIQKVDDFPLEDVCGQKFVASVFPTAVTKSSASKTTEFRTTECPCIVDDESSDNVTVTETATAMCLPTQPISPLVDATCNEDTAVSGQMSLKVKCCPTEISNSHIDSLCQCSKSNSFLLPKSTEELETLYDEISKRFKIRKLIVSAYSRNPTVLLRLPRPLPCFYVAMNRLDGHVVHSIEAEIIKAVIMLNAAISAGRYIPYGVSINAIRCAEGDKINPGRGGLESNEFCFELSGTTCRMVFGGMKLPSIFIFALTITVLLLI